MIPEVEGSMGMVKLKFPHPVWVAVDNSDYHQWCIDHLGYGTWMKTFGITGFSSTYRFICGEDALAFKIATGAR